jgi:hypothetical protein
MDNSIDRQARDTHQLGGIFVRILQWLADLVRWTEDDQRDAGIYHGDQYSR